MRTNNKPLRIAFVANSSWYLYNLRLGVMKSFQDKGYKVYTIAPRDNYTHQLLLEGFHHIDISTSNKKIEFLESISLFFSFYKIYKKLSLDLIFHYTVKPNIIGSIAAKLTGKKSISIVSGAGFTFLKKSLVYYFTAFLYRLSTRMIHSIWFVNKDDQEEFRNLKIFKAGKSKLLPGEGVNPTFFSPRPTMRNVEFSFLYSGRLIWDKGIREFVEAARLVKNTYPNVIFDVLGFLDVSNPHMISSEQIHLWQKEGIINYLGKTRDVRPYLAQSSCVVLPSYYREGTPRSLLEAAAMAKPIITTDNIGCREVVIDNYNGLLCQIRNVVDLANKMIQMIEMKPIDLEIMAWNGRKLVEEKFDEKYVIHHYHQTLQELYPSKRNKRVHSPKNSTTT